ncbi:hypothetical protein Tco_0964572 [Tanacetum coccineum]
MELVICLITVAMPVIKDEETLILEEESRSKMFEKAKDPDFINKNISHKPIDYEKLNRLTEDFGKRFTPQQELSAEQAFWLRMSDPTSKPFDALPVKIEAPKELPKISLVNESLKKLKFYLAKFDNVVKIRTTPNARTEGEWGFKHTKAVFNNEVIPFLKSLKDIFNVFDRDPLNEIMEVQTDFDQMDAVVQQYSVDKQCLEIAKKELLLENDRLLQQIMSQNILLTVMNSMSLIGETVNMDGNRKESCNLKAELLKSQNAFNDILKRHSQLKKHYISLECSIQLNQEIFQKHESCDNQNALEILEFFENNDLKAQLQDKDSTLCKLKDIIKSLREKSKDENVKYDYCDIETKNVELENSVAKLLLENERLCNEINHVKQVFKEQFDSIKKTCFHTKEQSDSLIDKLNLKSAKNEDLKAQIQDKVFVITSLKNVLQKIKGKEIIDFAPQIPSANTIIPGMFKLDLEPLAPSLLQNRDVHIKYLKYAHEQADTLRGIVKQAKAKQPVGNSHPKTRSKKLGLKCSTSKCGSKPTGCPDCSLLDSGNDNIARIMGYGDYQLGNVTISRIYYVEGLGHNLFSVGQFCDADLEVAFRKTLALFDKKPDLSFFHVFGALCYPTNDNDDLGKLDEKADIGLIPNLIPQQHCIPPPRDDWDHLFQLMFDEYFTPLSIAVTPVLDAVAPRAVVLADSPVLTFIDQDAPSSSTPSTHEQEQSPTISQSFEESPKTPIFRDNPLNESPHEELTSQGSSSNVRQTHTPFEHLGKWTKNHPIENVIGDPPRSVSTRKQL